MLTDVRGSLISQYTALFGYSGVEIRFTSSALDEICLKAAERGGGARGLRGIMVSICATKPRPANAGNTGKLIAEPYV